MDSPPLAHQQVNTPEALASLHASMALLSNLNNNGYQQNNLPMNGLPGA